MKRPSRWFGLLSIAIFATASAQVRADDKLEAFFPKETDIIVSFNIEQILGSELMKKYAIEKIQEILKTNDQAKQVLGTLGLDPLKDFSRVYLSGGFNFNEQKGLVVIEGKFDEKKIKASAEDFLGKSGDLQVEKIGGKTAYKFTAPNAPFPMYGSVVEGKYLVIGTDKEYLEGAFSAIGGKGKTVIEKDMASLLSKTDPKASMFLVANTKAKLGNLPIPNGGGQILEKIEFFAAELKVEKEIKLNLAMGVKDDSTAETLFDQLKQGLNGVKGLIPLFVQPATLQKPATDFVAGIKTSQKGKVITLTAEVTEKIIDALLKAGE